MRAGLVIAALSALAAPAAFAGCAANDIGCQQRAEAEQQKKLLEQQAAKQRQEQQQQQQQQQAERQQQTERQQQQRQQEERQQEEQRMQFQQKLQQPEPLRPQRVLSQPQPLQQPTPQSYSRPPAPIESQPIPIPNPAPAPTPATTLQHSSAYKINTGDGRQLLYRSNGTLASVKGPVSNGTLYPNGKISTLQTASLGIRRTPTGARIVTQTLPAQTSVVSTGAQTGYVQRSVNWQGRALVQRTFVNNGRSVTRIYGSYGFHGVVLLVYIPVVYYNPYYYGWAYFPWSAPVYSSWPWTAAPWYLANSGYFTVQPYYLSPAQWMTDQMLANTLQSSYADQPQPDWDMTGMAPGYVPDDPLPAPVYASADAPITPELKQSIADQVAQQVLVENAAAQAPHNAVALNSLASVLKPNHLFIVAQPLSTVTSLNQVCALRAGDVLQLLVTPDANAVSADLIVNASHGGDCPVNSTINVSFVDLQEMQNAFRYQLDRGLQTLNGQQGQRGLPTAPAVAYNPAPVLNTLPPPIANAPDLIDAAQQQADQSEAQLVRN